MSTMTADPRDGMPITPDWGDETRVYIDGRHTRNGARQLYCNDTGASYRWVEARRCYMVLLKGQDALDASEGWSDEFWSVVPKDADGALAMWVVQEG